MRDDYDHLAKPFRSVGKDVSVQVDDEDFLPDYLQTSQEALNIKRNPVSINLPWLIKGTPQIEIRDRYMGEQIFSRMRVHKNEVLHHLFKIYRAVLLSMADKDHAFLEQYCEKTFFEKLRNRLEQLDKEGIVLRVEEDMFADRGKPLLVEANMYDHTVIKGLSVVRAENGREDDYFIQNDIEDLGFISYVPKYISDPQNFADSKVNKEIHDEAHNVIFRAYVTFKTGYKLYLEDSNGDRLFDYDHHYSFQHVGVFETLCNRPPKFTQWRGSESLTEWV